MATCTRGVARRAAARRWQMAPRQRRRAARTFECGQLAGRATISYGDGGEYEGGVWLGLPHGAGTLRDADGTYTGHFVLGRRWGRGTETASDGATLDAWWAAGRRRTLRRRDAFAAAGGRLHRRRMGAWGAARRRPPHAAERHRRRGHVRPVDRRRRRPADDGAIRGMAYFGALACAMPHGGGVATWGAGDHVTKYSGEWEDGAPHGAGKTSGDGGVGGGDYDGAYGGEYNGRWSAASATGSGPSYAPTARPTTARSRAGCRRGAARSSGLRRARGSTAPSRSGSRTARASSAAGTRRKGPPPRAPTPPPPPPERRGTAVSTRWASVTARARGIPMRASGRTICTLASRWRAAATARARSRSPRARTSGSSTTATSTATGRSTTRATTWAATRAAATPGSSRAAAPSHGRGAYASAQRATAAGGTPGSGRTRCPMARGRRSGGGRGAADLGDEGVRRWVYVGEHVGGQRAGAGRCTFVADAPAETSEYVGEWGGGKREGVGRRTLSTGGAVVGRWGRRRPPRQRRPRGGGRRQHVGPQRGDDVRRRAPSRVARGRRRARGAIRHGVGVGKTAAGKEYEGQWVDGVPHGSGRRARGGRRRVGRRLGSGASRTGKVSSGAPMAGPPQAVRRPARARAARGLRLSLTAAPPTKASSGGQAPRHGHPARRGAEISCSRRAVRGPRPVLGPTRARRPAHLVLRRVIKTARRCRVSPVLVTPQESSWARGMAVRAWLGRTVRPDGSEYMGGCADEHSTGLVRCGYAHPRPSRAREPGCAAGRRHRDRVLDDVGGGSDDDHQWPRPPLPTRPTAAVAGYAVGGVTGFWKGGAALTAATSSATATCTTGRGRPTAATASRSIWTRRDEVYDGTWKDDERSRRPREARRRRSRRRRRRWRRRRCRRRSHGIHPRSTQRLAAQF